MTMDKKYIFTNPEPHNDGFFFPTLQSVAVVKYATELSPTVKETVVSLVQEKKIKNFYFSCLPYEDVYSASYDSDQVQHVGYLLDPAWITPEIKLYNKYMIDKYSDVMLVFDGRSIDPSIVPDEFQSQLSQVADYEVNPIPPNNSTKSSVGIVDVSSFSAMGLPQHAFFAIPSSAESFHFKEQWFSSSTDIKEEQHIGYRFDHDVYKLKSIVLLSRLGTHEQPGLSAPTPKIAVIEGLNPDTREWESLADTITFKKTQWETLTPIEIDLSAHKDVMPACAGFRVKVKEWFAGNKKDMLTGLLRVQITCYTVGTTNLPMYPTPSDQIGYAQFNPKLVNVYPPTEYPKLVFAENLESKEPSEGFFAKTTPSFTDTLTTLDTDGVISADITAAHTFSAVPGIITPIPRVEVEWCTQSVPCYLDSVQRKDVDTIIVMNLCGGLLKIQGDLPFYLPATYDTFDEFEMEPGDMIYAKVIQDKWYIHYIDS